MIKYAASISFQLKGTEYHEDDMATVQDQAETENRVSCPQSDEGRAQGFGRAPCEGSQAFDPGLRTRMSTRLPGTRYKCVFDRGRARRGRLLVAWHLAADDADRLAGVVVSKRTFHDAVDRNRAKRLMREAYRLFVKADEAPKGVLWVFIARAAIRGKTCADVLAEMRRLCARF